MVDWFIGVAKQTTQNKKLIHHSVLCHFQGFREEKTAYCTEHTLVYPNIPSALRRVKHDDSLSVRKPPQQWTLHEGQLTSISPEDKPRPSCSNVDPDFLELTLHHRILQSELNDLVRELILSKIQAELLPSHLKGRNLLQQGVKMAYGKCQQSLSSCFSKNSELVYCNDIERLLQELGSAHNPEEWRCCVDLSKFILKAILLHTGNIHPLILTAHSVHVKETNENRGLLLKAVSYSKYEWKICGDLKVIGLLLGLQSGCTKLCCCLCEWDSQA